VEKSAALQRLSSDFDNLPQSDRFFRWQWAANLPLCNRCTAMLAKYPKTSGANSGTTAIAKSAVGASAASDFAELVHLARAVLSKSPDDLAAIAEAQPAMPATWLEAFRAQQLRATAEAAFWDGAIAYLAAPTPGSVANDA